MLGADCTESFRSITIGRECSGPSFLGLLNMLTRHLDLWQAATPVSLLLMMQPVPPAHYACDALPLDLRDEGHDASSVRGTLEWPIPDSTLDSAAVII